jgi:amino acid transporter
MLATLLGAYTIVGFESASNLAEETHEPHKVIPRAMLRAVLLSGVVGFAFLIVVAYATNKAAYASAAPVASSEFRDAQYYVLGALGVGLVFYIVQLLTEREAMRREPGQG